MFQGAADGWQNENVFLMLANQFSPGIVDKAQAGENSLDCPGTGLGNAGLESPI